MQIKVCGIRDTADALAVVDAGADALGFLVGMRHLAEDEIDEAEAAHVISGLKRSGSAVECVMTTHMLDPEEILSVASAIGADTIQIHDDATPDTVRKVKEAFGGRVVKTVHVDGREATIAKALSYTGTCDAILLDSKTKDRIGGTGIPCDWDIAAETTRTMHEAGMPVYLAGGLGPGNVADAVAAVHPDGVDMNSGVEYPDGRKSFDKVLAVVEAIRKAGCC